MGGMYLGKSITMELEKINVIINTSCISKISEGGNIRPMRYLHYNQTICLYGRHINCVNSMAGFGDQLPKDGERSWI